MLFAERTVAAVATATKQTAPKPEPSTTDTCPSCVECECHCGGAESAAVDAKDMAMRERDARVQKETDAEYWQQFTGLAVSGFSASF